MPKYPKTEGSAYLITLLALVVLTMLGLALALASQTELLVGSNERTLQRSFYAAESGVHLAVARALKEHDKCVFFTEYADVPPGKPGSRLKAWVEYDPIHPVHAPWCDMCSVNDAGEYSANAFFKVSHQVSARSLLFLGGDVGARTSVTKTFDAQPWQDAAPPIDCGRSEMVFARERAKKKFKQ